MSGKIKNFKSNYLKTSTLLDHNSNVSTGTFKPINTTVNFLGSSSSLRKFDFSPYYDKNIDEIVFLLCITPQSEH